MQWCEAPHSSERSLQAETFADGWRDPKNHTADFLRSFFAALDPRKEDWLMSGEEAEAGWAEWDYGEPNWWHKEQLNGCVLKMGRS